jgi:hypothetical protein
MLDLGNFVLILKSQLNKSYDYTQLIIYFGALSLYSLLEGKSCIPSLDTSLAILEVVGIHSVFFTKEKARLIFYPGIQFQDQIGGGA